MSVRKLAFREGPISLTLSQRIVEGDSHIALLVFGVDEQPWLHWGVADEKRGPWRQPPYVAWPDGSEPQKGALQSPFWAKEGAWMLELELPADTEMLCFVIHLPAEKRWFNNGGHDYRVALRPAATPPDLEQRVQELAGSDELVWQRCMELEHERRLCLGLTSEGPGRSLHLVTDLEAPLLLHWGSARSPNGQWYAPTPRFWPSGTEPFDANAVQTPFSSRGAMRELSLSFGEDAPPGLSFVLCQIHSGGQRWLNEAGRDIYVRLAGGPKVEDLSSDELRELGNTIINHERERGSWTLMHRYNLCHDLLAQGGGSARAMALLFCWLRYSSLRQLTWQRNYNTKPRELAHAQNRLTSALAVLWRDSPPSREMAALMLSTLGRGSEGQRVRDEILEIMHRHRIKEVTGHFMEEWHQKLHNNTTFDDVVICEAYLAFLRADGAVSAFYDHLRSRGVSRQRLADFERPITSEPDFVPHLKDALLHDFGNYLVTLKRVHQGTDLHVALEAALRHLDGNSRRLLEQVRQHGAATGTRAVEQAERLSQARQALRVQLTAAALDPGALRDILFLDLALEEAQRILVERISGPLALMDLVRLASAVLVSVTLSFADEELELVQQHLKHLLDAPRRYGDDTALALHAIFERAARAVGSLVTRFSALLGPLARWLGEAFEAEQWTIDLFVDEVIRARSPFAFSAVLNRLSPRLRAEAKLSDWQLIHPGSACGRVVDVPSLAEIQQELFQEPTIVFAREVVGSEEIPANVVALLTRSSVDLVSHVAVRARDGDVLFAACHDDGAFFALAAREGELSIFSTAAGEVVEGLEERHPQGRMVSAPLTTPKRIAECEHYALGRHDFSDRHVGAKSLNIKRLAEASEQWPEWIEVPPSLALPFGAMERAMACPENAEVAASYARAQRTLLALEAGDDALEAALGELQKSVLALELPTRLSEDLRRELLAAHLSADIDEAGAWRCIKEVWASKWTLRATLSRRTRGLAHDALQMAVLVQPVVAAECAFVLHTVNPLTRDPQQIYGELVVGLGETLVSNAPGRAMAFVANKGGGACTLASFPSKSAALFGGGLIFRSDSSGEDLVGYAGAGLYESVGLPAPQSVALDYTKHRLTSDGRYREHLLQRLAELAELVEQHFGAAQDIEGAIVGDVFHIVQTRPQVGLND